MKEKLTHALNIPTTVFSDVAHIELSGNSEVLIDGCKGVLEYDDNVVKLNCGKNIVKLTGTNLTIRSLSDNQAAIIGTILSLSFS